MRTLDLDLNDIVGKDYADFWNSEHLYRILMGGRASKKSATSALNLIYRMMAYGLKGFPVHALVVRQTLNTHADSTAAKLRWAISKFGVDQYWKLYKHPLKLLFKPTQQTILFRGMEDPDKITSIDTHFGYMPWVWIEEAFELTSFADFSKLTMSIRGDLPPGMFQQFTMTFNPWLDTHWIKSTFCDIPREDTLFLIKNYFSNEFISKTDIDKFEFLKKHFPKRYAIEGLGQWGMMGGQIYENVESAKFDIASYKKRSVLDGSRFQFAQGIDWGFRDDTAIVCMVCDTEENVVYVYDEFFANEADASPDNIAEWIHRTGKSDLQFITDREPRTNWELGRRGVRLKQAKKGNNSVLAGIRRLQTVRFVVHPNCPKTFSSLSSYHWDEKSGRREQPDHTNSHGADAVRYGLDGTLFKAADFRSFYF